MKKELKMSDECESGGCLCGTVKYEFNKSNLISSHHCHCVDCQKSTGSGKANTGSLLDIIFANKIEQGSFECIVTEHKETEKELKEAKKWTGKFIFGITDKSCTL